MRVHQFHRQKNQFLLGAPDLVRTDPKFHHGLRSLLAFQLSQIRYSQI